MDHGDRKNQCEHERENITIVESDTKSTQEPCHQGVPSGPPSFQDFVEDNVLELTDSENSNYVDPSEGYEFVNVDPNWPSHLGNSDALLSQLTAMGIRVPKEYLTLDIDATNHSRSVSVSSSDGDDSWLDDEIYVEALAAIAEDHHVSFNSTQAEESFEELPKDYQSPVNSQADFQQYLRIAQTHEEEMHIKGATKSNYVSSRRKHFSSNLAVSLLKKKVASLNLLQKVQEKIKKFRARESSFDILTPDSGVHDNFAALTAEEQEKQREDWKSDLAKTEDEIQTLRQVLASKVKHAHDLKRRLGITVWREFSDDISSTVRSMRESSTVQKMNEVVGDISEAVSTAPLYQKTAGAMSSVSEKTGAIFGGIGAKFGQLRENQTFKSFEERVGSVYSSAKSKVAGSESNSTHDFEEALREAEAEKATGEGGTGPTGTSAGDQQPSNPTQSAT